MQIEKFIQQFENCIRFENWGHREHLLVGLWYMYHTTTIYEATYKMKCGIIRYAVKTNPEYTCIKRYNETVTWFWMHQIQSFIKSHPQKSIDELVKLLLDSPLKLSDYIFQFYTQEELETFEFRALYIPPTKGQELYSK